jgi:hypothetical protein
MEIGPIPGIRALPAVKARPTDPQLSAVFDIDALAKSGDSEWTESRKKAAGAEEDEEEEEGFLLGDEADSGSHAFDDAPVSRISYFA